MIIYVIHQLHDILPFQYIITVYYLALFESVIKHDLLSLINWVMNVIVMLYLSHTACQNTIIYDRK